MRLLRFVRAERLLARDAPAAAAAARRAASAANSDEQMARARELEGAALCIQHAEKISASFLEQFHRKIDRALIGVDSVN